MDSTPIPTQQPQPQPHLSIKASASKLPIKRKTPDTSTSSSTPIPNTTPNCPLVLTPKLESTPTTAAAARNRGDYDDSTAVALLSADDDRRTPPFKFHRIWTEPDEIRFLQGLLDCSSRGLSFPRDLHIFYAQFSDSMSQPYTKSQLSEKLRRLRKKFRVISARLAKGLDMALLSPHDRELYVLSKQLWHPDFSSMSPFGAAFNNNKPKRSNLVGVKVSFSPTLLSVSSPALGSVSNQAAIQKLNDNNCVDNDCDDDDGGEDFQVGGDVKLNEVNVEFEGGGGEDESTVLSGSEGGGGIGLVVAKTLIDVFDQSLKEVKMGLARQGLPCSDHGSDFAGSLTGSKGEGFEKRWREQRVAELDVWGHRLRLVLEHFLQRH